MPQQLPGVFVERAEHLVGRTTDKHDAALGDDRPAQAHRAGVL